MRPSRTPSGWRPECGTGPRPQEENHVPRLRCNDRSADRRGSGIGGRSVRPDRENSPWLEQGQESRGQDPGRNGERKDGIAMTKHLTGTREEWLAARLKL